MTSSRLLPLQFGLDQVWEIPSTASMTEFLSHPIPPISNLAESVERALDEPIEFPSLDQAVVPGDSLVFAIDPVVPGLHELLPLVVNWFRQRGCSVENMTLLFAGDEGGSMESLERSLADSLGESVAIEVHDPDDSEKVAYVAANKDSDPIYMNRTLVDADVVVPITCGRATTALDFLGAYSLYPLLSDRATRGAFYRLTDLDDQKAHDELTDWANQAAMWAGFMVAIQVIPAGNNQIAAVFAGLLAPLEKICEQYMDKTWVTEVEQSELTIALLDGGQAQQNWLGIARALHAAARCTRDHGAIVLCTQAKESIGKSMGRLRQDRASSPEQLSQKLTQDDSDDAIAAALVHETTRDKHLYLVSQMRADVLENLGIGVIKENRELVHLLEQFQSVTVLGSAQHRHIVLR